MANHSYLKGIKPITPEELEAKLRDINDRYFRGMLRIEGWDDPQGETAAWTLFLTDDRGFQLWLNDKSNIEAPHSLAWGNIFHWAQDLIMVAIRESHGGTIHDDGIDFEETLFDDCDSKGIDTFIKWWNRIYSHFDVPERQKLWNATMLDGPPDFMDFISE